MRKNAHEEGHRSHEFETRSSVVKEFNSTGIDRTECEDSAHTRVLLIKNTITESYNLLLFVAKTCSFKSRVLLAEAHRQLTKTSEKLLIYFRAFPQEVGVANTWHINNLSLLFLPNAKATRSKLPPTRYRDPLNTAAMLLFSWPYMWRNSTNIKDVCFLQSNIEYNWHRLPILPMGCGGEGPYGSVIQFVGVYLLLIEIIVPYLVLLKKKSKNTYTKSVAF